MNEVDINYKMSSVSINGDNNESKIVDLKSIIDNKRNSITNDKKRCSVTTDTKKKKLIRKKSTKIIAGEEDPRTSAIRCVQRFFRYFLLRKAGRISICENLFRNAFVSRTEESLTKALTQTNKWNIHSRLLRSYIKDAKVLLLDLGSESYIINELVNAIKSKTIELLTDAINLAQESHLLYIPEFREAKYALDEAYRLKNTLSYLEVELSLCTTVPKLLSKYDSLQGLVRNATALGLSGDSHVQDATLRLQRIYSLVQLRDKIRFAVEMCSVRKMDAAMKEREVQVKIYGPDLCAEEVNAVEGMRRMFMYESQVHIKSIKKSLKILSENEKDNKINKCAKSSAMDDDDDDVNDDEDTEDIFSNKNESDVRLPPFVRNQLEVVRNANTLEELNLAIENYSILVPSETKRKAYLRVFKWVVSFAFWRYEKSVEETTAHDQAQKTILKASVAAENRKLEIPKQWVRPSGLASKLSTGFSFGSKLLTPNSNELKTVFNSVSNKLDSDLKSSTPFSQRKSKAEIAAYIALKKGKNVKYQFGGGGKAEMAIAALLEENNK